MLLPSFWSLTDQLQLQLQLTSQYQHLVRDIKPPIHQSTNFCNKIFIYLLFSATFLYWNQPGLFQILKVAQSAFHNIIKKIITQNFAKNYSWFGESKLVTNFKTSGLLSRKYTNFWNHHSWIFSPSYIRIVLQ